MKILAISNSFESFMNHRKNLIINLSTNHNITILATHDDYLNEKKQYVLTSMNFRKILPYQSQVFKYKAEFIRKVLNLLVIS